MARSRRDRDVPRELHKRIEQIERDPKHPKARTGKLLDQLGFLAVIPSDEQPEDGWGWGTTLLSENITQPVLAGWGWGGDLSADNIGVPGGTAGWGWGATLLSGNITQTLPAGWGWAGQTTGTAISDLIVLEPDLYPGPATPQAGWGWGETVTASNAGRTTQTGWGWASIVTATEQISDNGDNTVNGAAMNDTAIN